MSKKRALIVDDSKTAQIRLKRMLERFDLDIDVSFSAEEALGYLSYQMPAVIFMDHHMEGMDGLDALRIIKANPNTAMVPVIMYTSESGDVYVGQARALGALDILSKEVIKSSGLEQVLGRLNIQLINIQGDTDEHEASTDNNETLVGAVPNESPATTEPHSMATYSAPSENSFESIRNNVQEVKTQIARLFEIHIADVRNQISDNSKLIVRRLSGEINALQAQDQTEENIDESTLNEEALQRDQRSTSTTNWLLLFVIIGLLALGTLLYQAQKKISILSENLSTNQQNTILDSYQNSILTPASSDDETDKINVLALVDTLAWAMNNELNIPYGSSVFDQKQLLNLQNFIYQLNNANYKGIVELNVHLGDFCLEQTPEGTTVLADDTLPFQECYFERTAKDDISIDDIMNVQYLQFEQTAAPIVNGNISLVLNMSGFDNPAFNYPTDSSTAKEWNAAALKNNRIAIRLGVSSDLL